jgi:hypothetical protein
MNPLIQKARNSENRPKPEEPDQTMQKNTMRCTRIVFQYLSLYLMPFLLFGCWSMVPVTLDEIKSYVAEKEQSFTAHHYRLLSVSSFSLQEMGFELEKILIFSESSEIRARWKDTDVFIECVSNTPTLTTLKSRIVSNQIGRQTAIEQELFNHIRDILNTHDVSADIREQTAGMIKIFSAPRIDAPVIGYLKSGMVISSKQENQEWQKYKVAQNLYGYILSSNLENL